MNTRIKGKEIRGLCAFITALSVTVAPMHVFGADVEAPQLRTDEMEAQLRPGIRAPLEQAEQFAQFGRPDEALALLEPVRAQFESGSLNYWETFDYHYVVGEAKRQARDWSAARLALEECMKFSDIDSERRHKLLIAIGRVYAQLKEAERAISVYEEINRLRGGRDPQMFALIAQVHERILGDHAAALAYYEDAVRYDVDSPDRSRYQLLRRAYVRERQYDKALEVAKVMVDLFDVPDDVEALDDILNRMNRNR